jgi:hypothetical protein
MGANQLEDQGPVADVERKWLAGFEFRFDFGSCHGFGFDALTMGLFLCDFHNLFFKDLGNAVYVIDLQRFTKVKFSENNCCNR